ncbi:MAG: hypothetical protein SGI89_11910 [bacterium]|nr:hypothetical protein [bacterium]
MLIIFSNARSNNSVLSDSFSSSDSLSSLKKNFYTFPDTTDNCDVIMMNGFLHNKVNLFGLNDSTVKILKSDVTKKIKINDIRSVKFKGRGFMKGLGIGALTGFVVGVIAGADGFSLVHKSEKGSFGQAFALGMILAIPLGVIGGPLGAAFAEDQYFNAGNLDFDSKCKKLYKLMKEYKD